MFVELVKGRSFLEIGCDTGFFPLQAGVLGASRAVGVDRNERALRKAERARRRLMLDGVKFVRGTVPDLGVDGPFDTVLLMSVIHYFFSDKCGNRQLFSSMEELVEYLSPLVTRSLLVEFVLPEDPMVADLVVDGLVERGVYGREAFISALEERFSSVRDLGATHRETRRLYLCEYSTS